MNEHLSLADALFPSPLPTLAELESAYPARNKETAQCVTRFAPSPTGFMHIGGLLSALISERLAHQSAGVFFLRIEDTDKKREVEGAIDIIVNTLRTYGIVVDEGEVEVGAERGSYGPYKQSARLSTYSAVVRHLILEGRAYPCFCTSEELSALTRQQEEEKIRPGYRGTWATCRSRSVTEQLDLLRQGTPYVIRLRSHGTFEHKVRVHDLIKGSLDLSENDLDVVLLKSDSYPTYHLAHVVDDHLMGTTDVIRGDEWLSSTPLHIELWQGCGWSVPRYGHIAPIQKLDAGSKRKLSKRKDPEANMAFYEEKGYPELAVLEYLMNLANSNFEDWRKEHPEQDYREFPFSLKKLNNSGALFDEAKLASISRDVISRMNIDTLYAAIRTWLKVHDPEFASIVEKNSFYVPRILSIDKDTTKRKDLQCWSETKSEISYFFDDCFVLDPTQVALVTADVPAEQVQRALVLFMETYDPADDRDHWFAKLKHIASTLGYAEGLKEYKQNPTAYTGHVGQIAQVLRIAVTGKTKTPDLCDIMGIMGKERVFARLEALKALLYS